MERQKITPLTISLFLLVSISILITCPRHASAAWVNLGLYGGQIYEIAIDPDNSNKMFAGAYYGDGLFVTTNGGTTWSPVLTGAEGTELDGEATFRNTAVWSVKLAPSNHNVVWAVHNYWAEKSTNGGATWTHIYNSTMQLDSTNSGGEDDDFRYCKSLAIHPKNPSIVYVGTGGPNSTNYGGAIYKTTDGGASWTKYGEDINNEFSYNVVDIAINPQNPNIMWALTFNDDISGYWGNLYISRDGGEKWELDMQIQAYIGETGLAVKANDPKVLLIATFYGIIRIQYDSTAFTTFTYTQPLGWGGGRNIRAVVFDPSDTSYNTVYAAGYDDELLKSTNAGTSFPDSYIAGKQFITLAPHPTNSSVIYGGERLLGVYKGVYAPSDYTWTAINNGVSAIRVNDIDVDPNDSTHLLAGTQAGVFEKLGSGPWTSTAPLQYTQAFSVAFDPSYTDGSAFYAGIESYLMRTTNHGVSWTPSNYLGYPHYVNDIAIDPNDPDTLFVTTYQPGAVYKSINYGKTLSNVTPPLANFDFSAVAIDPTDPDHIFAGGGNYFGTKKLGNLYESTDGGSIWTTSLSNIIVNALLIDPDNPDIIYAGCGYSGGTDIPLFKSTDGGTTWIESYTGIPVSNVAWNAVTDLTFSADGNLLASTERQGIYASTTEGRFWINMGAPPYTVYAVTSGSVIVGGSAGASSMSGEGILYGIVNNSSGAPIEGAKVETDLGKSFLTNSYGEWTMNHQSGWFDVSASMTGYETFTETDVEVRDATFTYVDFWLNVSSTTTDDTTNDTDGGGGGGGGGGVGIFGEININDVIGYHFDGISKNGTRIYMPVTNGIKALKGAQTHVENFAPALANLVRNCFDSLERRAEANKDGILYRLGTYLFPVLGKIAESYLDSVDSHELMTDAYSDTMISVDEFNKLEQQGIAVSLHIVKEKGEKQKR